jgi:hypothetical protein
MFPVLSGPGKLRTPCDRMQSVKATRPLACVVVVEAETFATPGEALPPPQPDASSESAPAATTELRMA